MFRTLGIDLGTTNSVMAYVRAGQPTIIPNRINKDLTPSVVGLGLRGELLVGQPARAGLAKVSARAAPIYSIKRFMGRRFDDREVQDVLGKMRLEYPVSRAPDGGILVRLGDYEYTPVEISAIILRSLKEDAEKALGELCPYAVITVPAYFGERQVDATIKAGVMAGFNVLRIVNEPTAAALAYGLNREPEGDGGSIVLVYDFGGGTFDISILHMVEGVLTGLAVKGNNLLGGDDFDLAIRDRLTAEVLRVHGVALDAAGSRQLLPTAEEAKIALSSELSHEVSHAALGVARVDLETVLTREEFEVMIRPRVEETVALTHEAIREAHLTPSEIETVLLVGGTTAIPAIGQALRTALGTASLRRSVNPMLCVALGAAIQGSLIRTAKCLGCHAENDLQSAACKSCGLPQGGESRRACPKCHVLLPLTAVACSKCKTQAGSGGSAAGTAATQPRPRALDECPLCGKPFGPGMKNCTICKTSGEADTGGLRCSKCSGVVPQGETVCPRCGGSTLLTDVSNATAKDIGIELNDGRMSTIIETGTPYPVEPIPREYFTLAGQQRLDVVVFEGSQARAQDNEFLGKVMYPLPQGTPARTGVMIAIGLDENRTLAVRVKLRLPGAMEREVTLRRAVIDAQQMRAAEEQREALARFYDRWHGQNELTQAEVGSIQDLIDRLDRSISSDDAAVACPLDELVAQAKRIAELAIAIRGADARIYNLIRAIGAQLPSDRRREMERIQQNLEAARERGDWEGGELAAKEANAATGRLPRRLWVFAQCQIALRQQTLPAALARRVEGVVGRVEEAVAEGDEESIEAAMSDLMDAWQDVDAERAHRPEAALVSARPQDK